MYLEVEMVLSPKGLASMLFTDAVRCSGSAPVPAAVTRAPWPMRSGAGESPSSEDGDLATGVSGVGAASASAMASSTARRSSADGIVAG